jgi:histidyl-tRNA synthetase
MSGLEAIGIAASIIQVAELGTKLSVKLFSFYRELKGANQAIQDLSSDVAITSAILHELGESLKEDEQAKLYSKKAFGFLQDVLNQCEEVLQQIHDMTKYSDNSEKTRLQQITEMFRQVVIEPRLDPLKASLKRLKSTMLLLLNVIMYAGQLRR